jgi:hypothetical protein
MRYDVVIIGAGCADNVAATRPTVVWANTNATRIMMAEHITDWPKVRK